MKDGGRYLVRDRVCLFFRQASERVERAEAAVPVERLLTRVLDELFTWEWLASVVNCVMARMCLSCVLLLLEDV